MVYYEVAFRLSLLGIGILFINLIIGSRKKPNAVVTEVVAREYSGSNLLTYAVLLFALLLAWWLMPLVEL